MKHTLLYILSALLLVRCAQITPLTGGKKDNTPPKLVVAIPANASINFNTKEINIEFDEYIILKDITNQFIITPQTKELPNIQAKGKVLKVTFNEALLPNTTYKLSFGNAVADIHESNSTLNFEYVFSTGTTIDSLKVSGGILYATNKKPASDLLVGLYSAQANDSVIYKEKPLYLTRTNKEGRYQFNYLPNKLFKLIAIDDMNKNLMYDGSDEQIAFCDSLVNTAHTNNVDLFLFKENPSKQFIKKTISNEYGKAIIIYNKPCKDITTVTWKNMMGSYQINHLQDSVTIYYENEFDTLKAIVRRYPKNDTLSLTIPTKADYEKLKKNQSLKYKITSNFSGSFPYYETPSIQLNFPFALDEIKKEKIKGYKIKDSTKTKLELQLLENDKQINSFTIGTALEKETSYQITFNKATIADTMGRRNDSVTFKFNTTSPDDYAQLNLKLLFPKKENYIVWLLNDKEQLIEKQFISISLASTNEKTLNYEHVIPGLYLIKVVEDSNKNNVFDTGDYLKHQQPETIFINSMPIKLLAGWEIESEWIVK